MKNKFAIIAILTISGCNNVSGELGVKSNTKLANYKVANAVPSLPVYHAAVEVNDDFVEKAKNKFKISGSKRSEKDAVIVQDGPKILRIDKPSGTCFYQDTSRMWDAKDLGSATLTDKDAVALAEAQVIERGLAPRNEFQFFQVNRLTGSNNIDKKVRVKQTEVVFKRKLNGHLIVGAGSQISVFLGNDGNVNGILHDWPALEKGKNVKIKEANDVFSKLDNELKKRNEKLSSEEKIDKFEPQATYLDYSAVYHSDGTRDIIPVFAVKGLKKDSFGSNVEIFLSIASDDVTVPNEATVVNENAAISVPPHSPGKPN